MSTVSESREAPSLDEPPIDTELIGDSTETALVMKLGTSTREDIDKRTPVLIGHLQQFLAEDLGADEDETTRQLFYAAYRLLDLKTRPAPDATTFAAYMFMREVASLTRRFLRVYTHRSGTGAS